MRSAGLARSRGRLVTWSLAFVVLTANAGEPPRAQQNTFRAGVTMVPIDVRAFDRQGKPVTDLTPEDFTIFEDGIPQRLAHFSTLTFTPEGPVEGKTSVTAGPVPSGDSAPATRAISPQTSRVYLIVLGRGRLQVPNQGIDGVLHFVRNRVLPQDRVAILAYNRATDFTTSHASLVPILERYKKAHEDIEVRLALHFSGLAGLYRPPGIPDFLQAKVDAIFDAPGAAGVRTMPLESGARDRTDAEYRQRVASALLRDPSASLSDKTEAAVEGMSFDAFVGTSAKEGLDIGNINAGINYLRHVDGEKHLIYVASGGFKTSGFVGTLDGVSRAASHARVALDIVHTGGIEFRGNSAQPQTIASKMGIGTDPFDVYLYGGTTIASAQTARRVAGETGGVFNANRYRMVADDLASMDAGARFQYTLGYYSSRRETDGDYRKIEVRTTRRDVTLRHRGGYYARPPLPALGKRELLSYTRISRGFEYAPQVEDIKIRGGATSSRDASGASQVRVDVTIDTSRLAFELVNGRHVGSVEVAVFALDNRQRQLIDLWQRLELDLSETTYQKFAAGGLPHSATLQLQAPQQAQAVKVVVYDYAADLVGSVVLKTGR